MEFPHLLRLIEETQFDTIYHEHFSYFSLLAVEQRLRRSTACGCSTSRSCATHGGSLRIYACHAEGPQPRRPSGSVELRERERRRGARRSSRRTPRSASGCERLKRELLAFLDRRASEAGKTRRRLRRAPRRATRSLNYCGIRRRPDRLRRRPQPAQAGPVPAREPHPDLSTRADRRDAARLPADPRRGT